MDALTDIDPQYPNRATLRPLGPRPDLDAIIARRVRLTDNDAADHADAGGADGADGAD